jgi:hypothetical protein
MMKYKSKIDWWFWCISILFVSVGIGMILYRTTKIVGIIWAATFAIMMLLFVFDTAYILEDNALSVRLSIFEHYAIPYENIGKVKQVHNFDKTRGIGLSADRIKIEWYVNGNYNYVYISPKDRDEFIKKLNRYRRKG